MVFLIKAVRCGWKQHWKMTRRHRTARFFKCGAQQCFHYRGYVTYIWTITRFMRMSDVAVWSIRTPFRQSSGPCVLGLNSIQSIWIWTSAPWSLSRHSLSQSSVSSKPAIIWYILWRSISVWLCTTIGFRRGSLIRDSMRSMMRFDDFSYSRTRGSPQSEESSGVEKSTVTLVLSTGSGSNS